VVAASYSSFSKCEPGISDPRSNVAAAKEAGFF
jgi:hypothetical protein